MATLRLTGSELGELQELLRDAFPRIRFDEFLLFRLNRRIDDYVGPTDDYPTALRKILVEANARLWWRHLLGEARNAVPGDPGLLAFGERYGYSPATVAAEAGGMTLLDGRQLELKIKAAQSTFDIGKWRTKLGEIEGRVCRIEYPSETARGTGFLVGASIVMTNYHVVQPIVDGDVSPEDVVVRFDYKVADDSVAVQPGTVHGLADDWLADASEYSIHDSEVVPTADPRPDQLDYGLLRVTGTPGREPVGGTTDDPNPTRRKWIPVPSQPHDFATHRSLYVVQHPDGKPMQVALDTEAIVGLNGNETRVRYTTTTEPGSSGSPCFGPDWQWVAVHHSGDPKYWKGQKPTFNQGIPLPAIQRLLAKRGKAALLGSAD